MPHIPILLDTTLAFFENCQLHSFVDGTLGGGGHALALLEAHPEMKHFYGFDRDESALSLAKERLASYADRLHLQRGSYAAMREQIEGQVEGIFLDLGVSSMQLDTPERGFSFSKEGPLDMRMDQRDQIDAAHVVNTYSEKELGRIFKDYGEEPRWRVAAKAIVEVRRKKRIKTTQDLAEALQKVLTWRGRKGKKIHPLTLIFQALRIEVNDELGELKRALPVAVSMLAPSGRMGVIAFHSLEDRLVKQTFRQLALEKEVTILTKKPLVASLEEQKANPRSRSAKLRFIEKL